MVYIKSWINDSKYATKESYKTLKCISTGALQVVAGNESAER